ncbi:MAG: CAP domain-containing protein, partial [Chloroflexota bacterium]|nr:CAP domain-containing protein [Chloroflexota bacterium]
MVRSFRRLSFIATLALLLTTLLPAFVPGPLPAQAQSIEGLAPPPIAGPGDIPAPTVFDAAAVTINPSNRADVVAFYSSQYLVSESAPATIGNASTCDPGATTTAFKNAVLQRINYFRAMAGVPPITELDATASSDAQQAALMMSANSALSHDPPDTWACYTEVGDTTAGQANLSLGAMGWDAIDLYMRDPGGGNYFVGHRRWVLYPLFREFGTGDTAPSGKPRANALKVFNLPTGANTTRDGYVAWPPPGYVPYGTVYPRWSFSLDGANFANATVTVTEGGRSVPVVIVNTGMNGFGLNTLVWTMDGIGDGASWPKPATDKTYQIQIGGVTGGPYNYSVTVIDPAAAAPTATATPSPSATRTATPSPTAPPPTLTPTATLSPSATATATATASASPSPTPSRTPTPGATASQTPIATPTTVTSPTSTALPGATTPAALVATTPATASGATATPTPGLAGPTLTPTSTTTATTAVPTMTPT